MTDVALGQLVLFLTTVLGFVVAAWREGRNRKWSQEDRENATAEIVRVAKAEAEATRIRQEAAVEVLRLEAIAVAERLRLEALRLAQEVDERAELEVGRIHKAISDVGQQAKKAYEEANHVNVKIEKIQHSIESVQQSKKDVSGG